MAYLMPSAEAWSAALRQASRQAHLPGSVGQSAAKERLAVIEREKRRAHELMHVCGSILPLDILMEGKPTSPTRPAHPLQFLLAALVQSGYQVVEREESSLF